MPQDEPSVPVLGHIARCCSRARFLEFFFCNIGIVPQIPERASLTLMAAVGSIYGPECEGSAIASISRCPCDQAISGSRASGPVRDALSAQLVPFGEGHPPNPPCSDCAKTATGALAHSLHWNQGFFLGRLPKFKIPISSAFGTCWPSRRRRTRSSWSTSPGSQSSGLAPNSCQWFKANRCRCILPSLYPAKYRLRIE